MEPRHFVPIKTLPFPTFRRILEVLRVKWRNSTPFAATFTRARKRKYRDFIFSGENRTHNLSLLQYTLARCSCTTTGLLTFLFADADIDKKIIVDFYMNHNLPFVIFPIF